MTAVAYAGLAGVLAVVLFVGGCSGSAGPSRPAEPASTSGAGGVDFGGFGDRSPSAGSADSGSMSLADEGGDMWKNPQGTPQPAPGQRHGDIRRADLTLAERAVQVDVHFAELDRTGSMSSLLVHLKANTGVRRSVRLWMGEISPRKWRGEIDIIRPTTDAVDCPVTHAIDYQSNDISLDIARSCLDDPRFVQMQMVSSFANDQGRVFFDEPLTDTASGGWSGVGHLPAVD